MVVSFGGWLRRRSNGVRVDRATYVAIRSANAARSRGDWTAAAARYRAALARTPTLSHIWIQLGHAAKESGDTTGAAEAYEEAASLRQDDPEPHMFLGHMAKRHGTGQAGHHYLAALRRAPDNVAAVGEVMQHLLGRRKSDEAFLTEALGLLGIDRASIEQDDVRRVLPEGSLFFDVTDLLSYFGFSRIPSGVQRVQIEMALALLASGEAETIALCYYSPTRQGWTYLSPRTFSDLCRASLHDDAQRNTDWAHELRRVYVTSALSDEVAFPRNSVLVSLGANAPDGNYLLDVRTACERFGIGYVPLIYDIIPMVHPEWVVPAHARDFSMWLHSMLHSARGYLSISDATRSDLLRYAEARGAPLDPDLVRTIPIDGDSIKPSSRRLPADALAKWQLSPDGYVLFVSTIEPRKNHIGAFRAWLKLAHDIGSNRLPDFVCVGGRGWLNDEIHAFRADHGILKRKVKILSGISDEELDLLYRNCAFTLYPSFYEGWGLPITESLCYGKVPAISDSTSMPEAGGAFSVYYDPYDADDIAAKVKPLVLDVPLRRAAEARIAQEFRAPAWADAGRIVMSQARAIADRLATLPRHAPMALSDMTYRLALPEAYDPAGEDHGEVFRHGPGWHLPDLAGCRVRDDGGTLRLTPADSEASVCVLTLSAGEEAAPFRVRASDYDVEDVVPASSSRTVRVPIDGRAGEVTLDIAPGAAAPLRVVDFRISGTLARSIAK